MANNNAELNIIDATKDSSDWRKLSHLNVCGAISNICFPKNINDIINAYKFAQTNDKNVFVIGGGSNTLIGYPKNTLIMSDLYLEKSCEINENCVIASANYNINELMIKISNNNLSGIEFLAGIPAHIGGIVIMNAGADNCNISNFIEWIEVVDINGLKRLYKKEIQFSYRQSDINGFITKICIKLNANKKKDEIAENIKVSIIKRSQKQPLEKPNLGCFFKNTPQTPTGLLIEKEGLKGKKIGGAMVSHKHANFIINDGNAKFEDFIYLIEFIKDIILNKYNIILEEEIRILND